jgi:hypothetical protein
LITYIFFDYISHHIVNKLILRLIRKGIIFLEAVILSAPKWNLALLRGRMRTRIQLMACKPQTTPMNGPSQIGGLL